MSNIVLQGCIMNPMNPKILLLTLFLGGLCMADDLNVDSDPAANFASFKTFRLQPGRIVSQKPELNNPLVEKRIEAAIREQLSRKGMTETTSAADVGVTYRLGAADQRQVDTYATGRYGRGRARVVNRVTEGTLVIDITRRDSRDLVFRGTFVDEEGDAAKLSKKLESDVKKIFDKYPPKK